MQNPLVLATEPIKPASRFRRVWPPVILILGLGLTAAWTAFLAYDLMELMGISL